MVKIDLHSHSTRSDGLDTPSQLVANAAKANIDVLALTDHDTVSGWDEARSAAIKLGLGFVPGIEVTSVPSRPKPRSTCFGPWRYSRNQGS
jgi:predicted metal-dependent phosphoesterase TrpH